MAVEDEKEWAWSAWSVWRGDLSLLARMGRVALDAVGDDGKLSISVTARDDCEVFSSVDDFVEQVTPQAMRRFTKLEISASASSCGAEVLIARRKKSDDPPFEGNRGLVVQAWAEGDNAYSRAVAACDSLRIAARRGSLPWTKGLSRSETEPRPAVKSKLKGLDLRRRMMTLGIVSMLATLPYYALFLLAALHTVDYKTFDKLGLWLVCAQILTLLGGALAAPLVMPPIDVADITPGRRMLRLIGRSGVLTVGSGLALAFAKNWAGLST